MPEKRRAQTDLPAQRSRWVVAAAIVGLAAFCAIVEASQNYIGAINFGRPVAWRESFRRTLPSWALIALLTLSLNLLGDSIRDAFDPRTRR